MEIYVNQDLMLVIKRSRSRPGLPPPSQFKMQSFEVPYPYFDPYFRLRTIELADNNKRTEILQEIAVVIPTYKACNHILGVIDGIGPEVARIYVVDDCCPDGSGDVTVHQPYIDSGEFRPKTSG